MRLVEIIIEKVVHKTIADIEKLTEQIEMDNDAGPVDQARIVLKNKPVFHKLLRKQMFLTMLKGV